ncbi:MFS transporter [Ramlibacter sp. MAHUQ-53]|uniref:MFS transporter n=1 Tax=unclassified Ramlibacter TaxID=2617605 RepID=UPI003634390C
MATLPTALAPLQLPVFRLLWLTWFAANTTMWMNDVAGAWLMTSLAPSPLWVALVQAASTLPVFFLGLPSGALADIVDRRRFLLATQLWLAAIAAITCTTVLLGWMTAPLLLALTFLNGIGLALRWPVFAAIMPEVLPRPLLAQGLALNGISMNGARIIGPLVAGAIIASLGSAWVFVLNTLLSLMAAYGVMRWHREHKESPLGREPLGSAIRVGLQFVRESHRMRGVLARISLFFLHCTALLALLPLVAKGLPGGDAGTFTLLLASMGSGAIVAVLFMPRLRQALPGDRLVITGTVVQSLSAVAVAWSPHAAVAAVGMFVCGVAWISVANTNTVAAQMALPDWVRARGMSMYQMAIMGSTALGAALWGQVATWLGITAALEIAAVTSVVLMVTAQRLTPDRGTEEDLSPAKRLVLPEVPVRPGSGRILTRVEYRIDPARAEDFMALMNDSRSSRLRQGALAWQLLHDVAEPGRYVEQIIDESWTEHLRRFDRISADDAQLRDRRMSFHLGEEPPRVTRYVIEQD